MVTMIDFHNAVWYTVRDEGGRRELVGRCFSIGEALEHALTFEHDIVGVFKNTGQSDGSSYTSELLFTVAYDGAQFLITPRE